MNIYSKELVFEDCNGFTNRDTFLIELWLTNWKENYNTYKSHLKWITNLNLQNENERIKLMNYLYGVYTYNDKVNYENVDLLQVQRLAQTDLTDLNC